MTLWEELRNDLNHLPFVKSDMGKKILNCEHCVHCKPMNTEYQKYNFLEDDSVVFCAEQNCCTYLNNVCAKLMIDIENYCDMPNCVYVRK